MKELLTCCYELMEIELRAQHTENLFTLLCMAERIDLQLWGGIIESRYSDDQPRDEHGRWTDGGGGDSNSLSENSKKPITEITEKAIGRVPYVAISGYSEEQCKKIQEQHKNLLRFARDENGNKETAFVFRKDLSDRLEVKGTDDRLDFGGALHGKGTDLIVMHNHPRNSSYSTTDLDFFAGNTEIRNNNFDQYRSPRMLSGQPG